MNRQTIQTIQERVRNYRQAIDRADHGEPAPFIEIALDVWAYAFLTTGERLTPAQLHCPPKWESWLVDAINERSYELTKTLSQIPVCNCAQCRIRTELQSRKTASKIPVINLDVFGENPLVIIGINLEHGGES